MLRTVIRGFLLLSQVVVLTVILLGMWHDYPEFTAQGNCITCARQSWWQGPVCRLVPHLPPSPPLGHRSIRCSSHLQGCSFAWQFPPQSVGRETRVLLIKLFMSNVVNSIEDPQKTVKFETWSEKPGWSMKRSRVLEPFGAANWNGFQSRCSIWNPKSITVCPGKENSVPGILYADSGWVLRDQGQPRKDGPQCKEKSPYSAPHIATRDP